MPEQSDPKNKPTGDYVFISYAREDQAYARKLVEDLHKHGFEAWIDDRIDFGARWWKTIEKTIHNSAAFIVIMTPYSDDSEWVEREILVAQRESKPIFPLLLSGREFSLLITTQYVDVTTAQTPPVEFYERLGRVVPPKLKEEKKVITTTLPKKLSPRQDIEPEMVLIPAGVFLMGSNSYVDKHAKDNEQPQHRLYLPDYYIAKTPVTNFQYAAFLQKTGHRTPDVDKDWSEPFNWSGQKPPAGTENLPVVMVSWDDAVAYCKWLSEVTGRTYRLPTEAEWEKAARGTDGRIYPWGNQWDESLCKFKVKVPSSPRGGGRPRPYPPPPSGTLYNIASVGTHTKGASPYGLLNMAGNVWEWCATKAYKPYPYDIEEDEWTEDYLQGDDPRVLRGGSWCDYQDSVRCATRHGFNPGFRSKDFGFRIMVSPKIVSQMWDI